jgi:hypothetical protein
MVKRSASAISATVSNSISNTLPSPYRQALGRQPLQFGIRDKPTFCAFAYFLNT